MATESEETTFEEIKMRREAFDALRPEDYFKSRGEPKANKDFWTNIDDDSAWLIDEVERLRAELAKFVECKSCTLDLQNIAGVRADDLIVWHKEGE